MTVASMGTMESGSVTFDTNHWPLVVMTLGEKLSDGSVGQIAAFFHLVHARKELFALLVDTTRIQEVPSATWRRQLTDWTGKHEVQENSKKYNVGTAVVLSSAFARGAFVAIGWLWKPASPVRGAATADDAVDWCSEQLERAGVDRSPKLLALQRSLREAPKPRTSAR